MYLGWSLRMHSLCLLFNFLPKLLVELWQVPWTCSIDASLQMDYWFKRSQSSWKIGQIERSLLRLQVSHNYELHQNLSQGLYQMLKHTNVFELTPNFSITEFESWTRYCWNQETSRWNRYQGQPWIGRHCWNYQSCLKTPFNLWQILKDMFCVHVNKIWWILNK